jgi:hypothetical protein
MFCWRSGDKEESVVLWGEGGGMLHITTNLPKILLLAPGPPACYLKARTRKMVGRKSGLFNGSAPWEDGGKVSSPKQRPSKGTQVGERLLEEEKGGAGRQWTRRLCAELYIREWWTSLSPSRLVSFLLLWQSTWEKLLKGRIIYFGSWFLEAPLHHRGVWWVEWLTLWLPGSSFYSIWAPA